jgi:hypothetical protein
VHHTSPRFPSTKCHLYINDVVVTSKLKSKIRLAYGLPGLKKYIIEQNGWEQSDWDDVNWGAHAAAFNKLYTRRRRIVQFVHNLLPTGTILQQRLSTYDCICKACNTSAETNGHMLRCTNNDYQLWRVSLTKSMIIYCQSIKTDPVLTELLIHGLEASTLNVPVEFRSDSDAYMHLVNTQGKIGWNNFIKGRFCNDWDNIQAAYLRQIKETSTKLRANLWSARIIAFIWEKWNDLWVLRNSYHHGSSIADKQTRQKEKAASELEYLYTLRGRVQYQNLDVFRESLEVHLTEPVSRLLVWIRLFKQLIINSKHTLKKSTREDIRLFFGPRI